MYLPLVALVAWGCVARGGVRRAWVLVLALAALHLAASSALLTAWRGADRAAAPFLLPDLAPVRSALEARGIRRAYASYGPAYRLTFETGERVIASQPWNERFLHFPLPYLDEVRFARDVAWVLTPAIPSDLPDARAFEEALAAAGGTWQRETAGAATVYTRFEPPFAPAVEPLASAGAAGDGDPATHLDPEPDEPVRFDLPAPSALAAVTLVAAGHGPALPRSMDVEVSADGATFESVASRRRRGERGDLRWVNGHPQYVIDNDVLAVPLGGRTVRAIRITPGVLDRCVVAGGGAAAPRGPRRRLGRVAGPRPRLERPPRALDASPRRDREDWYTRWVLVAPPRASALLAGEELLEGVGVDRLHQVVVEAGLLRPVAVLLLAVAGEGDQHPAAEAFLAQLRARPRSRPSRAGRCRGGSPRGDSRGRRPPRRARRGRGATSWPQIFRSSPRVSAESTLSSTTRMRLPAIGGCCHPASIAPA